MSPLEMVRAQLYGNPREHEYIDLGDTSAWTDDLKQEVVAELLDAANRGDPRAVTALLFLMPREWLRATFEKLLAGPHLAVRVEAGRQLAALLRANLEGALEDGIKSRQLDDHWLGQAVDLLLEAGDASAVRRLVRQTTRESVRTVLLDKLWTHARLHIYPSVWWSGLGLLRTRLLVPMASFRDPALDLFEKIAASGLVADHFPPMSAPLPPALIAAVGDVARGKGPIDDGLIAPLSVDEREALKAHAAKQALEDQSPRAVAYVAKLGGAAHRDLYDWAAAQNLAPLAQAGKDALAALPKD